MFKHNTPISHLKKIAIMAICAMMPLFFSSCVSKEKKAEKLIAEHFEKTLLDYDSYQPVETTVGIARHTRYNDTVCRLKALVFHQGIKLGNKYLDEMEDASRTAQIWGRPTSYSSSYSDSRYDEAKREYDENRARAYAAMVVTHEIGSEMDSLINSLDTAEIIGWEVNHRFRCKSRGGSSLLCDYRFVIDKKFKTIIISESEDEEDKGIKECLDGYLGIMSSIKTFIDAYVENNN